VTIAEKDAITAMPGNLTIEEAAPITEVAHYALCDIRSANIKSGQIVMIYGATGAIGSAAEQLLKYFGTKVTAACDTRNAELMKRISWSFEDPASFTGTTEEKPAKTRLVRDKIKSEIEKFINEYHLANF
jgi:NADPH:quinone reductase-like Zn-dependent oxidoreductase